MTKTTKYAMIAILAVILASYAVMAANENATLSELSNSTIINATSFVTEQITCVFNGATSINKCYLAGEFTSEDEGTKWCKSVMGDVAGKDIKSCTINFGAKTGEKITWKSSCGGYQYTMQDGNPKTIYFDCSAGEKNETQVSTDSFLNAKWQCRIKGDVAGKEDLKTYTIEGEKGCLSYSAMKEFIIETCGGSENVVAPVSISGSCYRLEGPTLVGYTNISMEANATSESVAVPMIGVTSIIEKNITESKISVCRDSCAFDGKCYPFGYRRAGEYCSDSGSFTSQSKGDASCENNFECSSNVCINGTCVSQSLIEKFLNWFKKLFS